MHELDKLHDDLKMGKTWGAVKTMVAQIEILETMTPLGFDSFQGFLDEASEFQSVQFYKMAMVCGHRSKHILKVHKDQPQYVNRIQKRMK